MRFSKCEEDSFTSLGMPDNYEDWRTYFQTFLRWKIWKYEDKSQIQRQDEKFLKKTE